jgi:ferrochelatase
MSGERLAVVLFNLGGPASLSEVRPFLKRLFADRAIIDLPAVLRLPIAETISRARLRSARANYASLGGASPLLAETKAQARALETVLESRGWNARAFIAMRYARPFSAETARAVAAFAPQKVVLAPLYPQYSTTTTASSLAAWRAVYRGPGATHGLCCWFANQGLIDAHAEAILETWTQAGRPPVRLLFSAHGLPLRIAERGDPYAWQVEATCKAIAARLGESWDWRLCYQSRVGPLKWLGPSTPEAITDAARVGLGVLVDPVSFVSEHVETLIELDRDYQLIATAANAPSYLRAPTVSVRQLFIDGLADAIEGALGRAGLGPAGATCPARFGRCGWRLAA